jgi:hypothetical protein
MGSTRYRSGPVTVTLEGVDEVVRAAEAAAHETERTIRDWTADVVRRARALWPVRTGASRAGLGTRDTPRGSAIVDDVAYVLDVRPPGGERGDAWRLWVEGPVGAELARTEAAAAGAVDKAFGRAVR